LVVTEGNVTQLLDKLEKQGLVTRHADGRCNRRGLTIEGRRLYQEVRPEQNRLIAKRFAVLTPREQEELRRLLRKLSRSDG
jgi:MarR family 2-MHQ and catechol resistance regulon transcriptional repressor